MPAPILLPPSFQNSFWSQDDFRTGMEVLFGKLEQGCLENQEIITFIKAQASAHHSLADSLSTSRSYPTFSSALSTGLSASLAQSFNHLQTLSQRQASQHASIAEDLERRVLEGFIRWANVHEMRTRSASQEVLGYVPRPFEERGGGKNKGEGSLVGDYGKLVLEVAKLRQTYLVKANHADDLEEEARFHTAVASPKRDTFTPEPRPSSPRLQTLASPRSSQFPSSVSPASGLKRTGTVAERISEKLRMASVSRSAAAMESMMIKEESEPRERPTGTGEKLLPAPPIHNEPPARPKSMNGIVTSGLTSTDPSAPLLLAGLSLPLPGLVALLTDFARHLSLTLPPTPGGETAASKEEELRSRTRTTLFGTFDESFSGAEFVDWLLNKLEGFAGQRDRAEEAGSELLRWGLIGRIGMGKGWDSSEETYYVLKDSATEDSPFAIEALRNHIHASTPTIRGANGPAVTDAAPSSPNKVASPTVPSLAAASSMIQNYLPQALKNASMNGEAGHIKARRDAKAADEEYREALGELEDMRLGIEARLESGMGQWEGWERERLKAVKTVLSQYDMVMSQIPKRLHEVSSGVKVAVEAYKPEADLLALVEGSRTGNFRPKAHIYDSLDSDDYDVTFGIDLRKWGGQQGWKAIMRKEATEGTQREMIPHVLTALLQGLEEKYKDVSDDVRRKSWLYLVSLGEVHPLRELVNDPHVPTQEMVKEVTKFNAPVIAATVKLWLLELNPSLLGYDSYEPMKTLYKKGNDRNDTTDDAPLVDMLSKLSSPQILVLDAVLAHFNTLIKNTKTEESDDAYITKLSLSVGRHFLRPQVETVHTLQDHTPSRLFSDLLRKRDAILPTLVERARKTLDRPMPQRKATRPVDQRISRSKLSVSGEDGREVLRAQAPRTPSRSSIQSLHGPEASTLSSHEEEIHTPRATVALDDAQETSVQRQDAQLEPTPLASPVAVGTGNSRISSDAAEPAAAPIAAVKEEQTVSVEAQPVSIQNVPDARPVTPVATGTDAPASASDVVLSLDGDRSGFAGSGARLSRKRPVSKDLDQPVQEGDSTLRRTGSSETSKIRGPRLATRGPRPVPSKIAAEISSPTSARPSSPSIRDRIANLENKANTGADRFV